MIRRVRFLLLLATALQAQLGITGLEAFFALVFPPLLVARKEDFRAAGAPTHAGVDRIRTALR